MLVIRSQVAKKDAMKFENYIERPHKLNKMKFDCQTFVSLDKLSLYKKSYMEAELNQFGQFVKTGWTSETTGWTGR